MGIPNTMLIDINILERQLSKEGSLEDRIKEAMKLVKSRRSGLMFAVTFDQQFRTAIGGVILHASEEERARITLEMRVLGSLSAAIEGLPIDLSQIPEPEKPIGLLKLWHES